MKNLKWFFAFFSAVLGIACEPVPIGGGGGEDQDIFITIVNQVDTDGDCQTDGDPLLRCLDLPSKEERDNCTRIVQEIVQNGYTTTSMSCGGLVAGDCDPARGDVCLGCTELCDNRDNDCDGAVDDGLAGCCDDIDVCTNSHFENYACVHTPITGCCNADSDCSGATPWCTSQSALTAGTCVRCTANAHCDDRLFCTGLESCQNNVCQQAPGGACSTGSTCDEANDRCVGCLSDADCRLTDQCNQTSRVCERTNCDDGNVCTVDAAQNHTAASCTHAWTAGCCRGPTYDADCTAANGSPRPANLPTGYDWGCSTGQVNGWNVCTECDDYDGDNQCPSNEWCGTNGWDDDGDGLVDETPCVQQPPPDAGVSDSGTTDMGTPDSGVPPDSGMWQDASVADSGVPPPECVLDSDCPQGEYCGGGTCYPFVDLHGQTPECAGGAQGGPQPDMLADTYDWDGDGRCATAPCVGSRNPTYTVSQLQGGDCDDNPYDDVSAQHIEWTGSPRTGAAACSSDADCSVADEYCHNGSGGTNLCRPGFRTDGSFFNHPGTTDWCTDSYDNNCNGTGSGATTTNLNEGCPANRQPSVICP
jgi:hypothetical protein